MFVGSGNDSTEEKPSSAGLFACGSAMRQRPGPLRPPQNFNNGGLNTRRRDGSLNRENTSTFKDAFMAGNKGRKNF